jgi:hypothetical protein
VTRGSAERGQARAGAEARQTLARRLRSQADASGRLGSPLYADLLGRAADEVVTGDAVYGVLEGHEHDPGPSVLALRLMGAVHRLVLRGDAPELAVHYPSAGGRPGDAWPAFVSVLRDRRDELRRLVENPVQTNEPGRCAALLGGFLEVARATGLPLRLLEVGASAGLNLRFDRYRYELGGERWGPPDSPLVIRARLAGAGRPPLDTPLRIASRAGCDARPVDPRSEDGRLTLTSYVWPDQLERLERLRAALQIAGEIEAPVERAGAADWIETRLAEPAPGTATVVFHSIVMQYLPAEERERFERAARTDRVAWLRMEPADEAAEVRLRLAGEDRLIARAGYHGDFVEWLA